MSEHHGDLRPSDDSDMTIDELAERQGLPVRTIRFYIAQGLLPGPGSRGKSAAYGEEHLVRLRLIRRLSERHVPLSKIQDLLQGLSLDEVKALLVEEEDRLVQLTEAERQKSPRDYVTALLDDARQARQTPQQAAYPATSPGKPPLSVSAHQLRTQRKPPTTAGRREGDPWLHWTLAPGVELHVSAEARARYAALIQRLLRAAGEDEDAKGD